MHPPASRSRAVVLLSGGMDSCVCAALAARDHQAAAVHVSYGQRTEARERQSFERICDRLDIRDRLLVRNEALRAIGGSALTDSNIAVPESHALDNIRRRHPRHLCPLPQRAFPGRRRQLGRSARSRKSLHRSRRARQFRLSRLPPGVLSSVQ